MTDAATDLDQLSDLRVRAGRAVRDLGHALVGHHADAAMLQRLAVELEALTDELDRGTDRNRDVTSFGSQWGEPYREGVPLTSFADRPVSGQASPWGLDLEVHRHGDEIEAIVTLRSAHEGAPGRSHGGIVAALFDDVFGFVLGVVEQAAFTGELTIRYVGPTPLHRPLACRARLAERHGRKLTITGELVDLSAQGEPVVARASSLFIAVDREQVAALTAERPPPPDEG